MYSHFLGSSIYFWLHWVSVALCGLSLVVVSWGHSSSRCIAMASLGGHRLSSCGAQAELLYSVWNLLGSGIEPMSPALGSNPPHHQGSPRFIHFVECINTLSLLYHQVVVNNLCIHLSS